MKIDTDITEKKFQAKVVKYLQQRGAYVVVHTATGYGRAGIPDILACFEGVFLGIEVKRETGTVTAHQERELKDITKAGGWAIDLYPSKMKHLAGLLDLIEDLAMRNRTSAKRNHREAMETLDEGQKKEILEATSPGKPEAANDED